VCRNILNGPDTLKRLWYTAVRSGRAIAECLQDMPLYRQCKTVVLAAAPGRQGCLNYFGHY